MKSIKHATDLSVSGGPFFFFFFAHAGVFMCRFMHICITFFLFSSQNIHSISVYSSCLVLSLVLFTLLSAPHMNLFILFYFFKSFRPAPTLAPAKGLKATHTHTQTGYRIYSMKGWELRQQHCAGVSGEVLSLSEGVL